MQNPVSIDGQLNRLIPTGVENLSGLSKVNEGEEGDVNRGLRGDDMASHQLGDKWTRGGWKGLG